MPDENTDVTDIPTLWCFHSDSGLPGPTCDTNVFMLVSQCEQCETEIQWLFCRSGKQQMATGQNLPVRGCLKTTPLLIFLLSHPAVARMWRRHQEPGQDATRAGTGRGVQQPNNRAVLCLRRIRTCSWTHIMAQCPPVGFIFKDWQSEV